VSPCEKKGPSARISGDREGEPRRGGGGGGRGGGPGGGGGGGGGGVGVGTIGEGLEEADGGAESWSSDNLNWPKG